jgi:TPR repeat protein
LAFCLQKGIGVQKDLTRAQELYEHSGAAGYGFAAYRLGMAFIQGEYGFIDSQRAVRLMERAYALGEPRGASALAQWFESGERVERDPAAAVSWLERASELGDFTATHRLQLAYMLGDLGLPRDPIKIKEYETRFYEQTEPCTSSVDGSASHE